MKTCWSNPYSRRETEAKAAYSRPFSLTCICCKLPEDIVRSETTGHLHRNNIITDAQHDFCKRHSYETQLIVMVDPADNIDKGGQTDVILLDFLRAFDKVPLQHLRLKLDFYGIRGKTKR